MPGAQSPPASPARSTGTTFTLPNHPSFSEILAINDLGDIAVDAGRAAPSAAYVDRLPYGPHELERKRVPASSATTITAISNAGMAAGFYTVDSGKVAAFAEKHGVWTRYLGPAGAEAVRYLGVNDAATAVGFYTDHDGADRAFARDIKTGTLIALRPPEAASAAASGINNGDEVVGYLTTSRGRVKGFYWKDGRVTQFSYPRAIETKALGISNNGRIVGSYVDASHAAHGFIVRDLATHPEWKAFDAPRADGLTVLTGVNDRGDVVGYYRDENLHVRALYSSGTKKPQEGVPLVIPVWAYGGDPGDTDPGPVPDQHLFAAILDNSSYSNKSLAANCPGVSGTSTCQPYKYIDLLYDHCQTPATLSAYQWADADDETAFQHVYPGAITAGNRITYDATPNPDCTPDSHNADMRMNPGDAAFNAYLYENVWSGTNYTNDFPSPYGVMEDQASVFAGIVVGGSGEVSTEYGSGIKPSGFANLVGNSPYHAVTDWETALGVFVNGACGTTCLSFSFNGVATGFGNVGPCKVIGNGHCHSQYSSGLIDNQAAIDNICQTVTGGNLKYFMAERPIYAGRFGFGFLNGQTVVVQINTSANLYSHTSDGCANAKIFDLEPSYGPGGLGDVTGGYRVRLEGLALRWLVANPSTGIPDRRLSMQYTEDGTSTEAPYFFEDTLVPYGPETSVSKYVWNGKVWTTGGGCPSASGDTGGAVSLLVQCAGSDGIYCQQYQHLYINGADYGAAAACLNTSSATQNIAASWFAHDPISTYQYELSFQGGELTSVPYQDISGGSIALSTCTNKRFCTGSNQLSAQVAPFKGDGTDQLCGPCGVILLHSE